MRCCPRCQPPEWLFAMVVVLLSVVMGAALFSFAVAIFK
jgi:hypothetical protein